MTDETPFRSVELFSRRSQGTSAQIMMRGAPEPPAPPDEFTYHHSFVRYEIEEEIIQIQKVLLAAFPERNLMERADLALRLHEESESLDTGFTILSVDDSNPFQGEIYTGGTRRHQTFIYTGKGRRVRFIDTKRVEDLMKQVTDDLGQRHLNHPIQRAYQNMRMKRSAEGR